MGSQAPMGTCRILLRLIHSLGSLWMAPPPGPSPPVIHGMSPWRPGGCQGQSGEQPARLVGWKLSWLEPPAHWRWASGARGRQQPYVGERSRVRGAAPRGQPSQACHRRFSPPEWQAAGWQVGAGGF